MLSWYQHLYLGTSVERKARRLRWKINTGRGTLDLYVITIASNPANQFDIISTMQLQKKSIRKHCPMIVGLARGRFEAMDVVRRIFDDAWKATHDPNARAWILEKHKGE